MKLQRKTKLLAIPAIIINSMLIGMGTAQANPSKGFTQTCTDSAYQAGILTAECRTINGGYRTSSIDLNSYIANHDGDLVWNREGNFADTSNNCNIYSSTLTPLSYLSCSARTIDARNSIAILTLDEHIKNVDGQLQYYQ